MIDIKDEFDINELITAIRSCDGLVMLADYAGSGKSYALKKAFENEKDTTLWIVPSNKLGVDYLNNGFKVNTINQLLCMRCEDTVEKDMKKVDLSDIKTIIFDEIYCYGLYKWQRLHYFMKNSKDIAKYATGDVSQLEVPKEDGKKEIQYFHNKVLRQLFPNCIHLKINKRCKTEADRELLKIIKAEIFDYSYEWNLERKKHICRHFKEVAFKDIKTVKNLTYYKETANNLNRRVVERMGGLKAGMVIMCKERVKIGDYQIHNGYEFEIAEVGKGLLKLYKPRTKEVFEITKDIFLNKFEMAFAFTNHKCQGVSINEDLTVCDLGDLRITREWLYVALTRATEMRFVSVCFNKPPVEKLKNIHQKIEGHKKEDVEKGREFAEEMYVSEEDIVKMLKKQMYKCYFDDCRADLEFMEYEAKSPYQYSIDRIDNKKAHLKNNFVVSCYNCNCRKRSK